MCRTKIWMNQPKIVVTNSINCKLNEISIMHSYQFKKTNLSIMKYIILLVVLFYCNVATAQIDSLALTPPMGWNSWNCFQCNIDEEKIKEIADLISSNGMKDAGYEYIVIDDCWQVMRDSVGNIIADPVRFPSGIKSLSDYVHSKGLKFGIYSCAGSLTCKKRPGSRGYQFQDARTYAEWGVDFLKYDWCNSKGQSAQAAYSTMKDALVECGRPIVFSICEWGDNQPWTWGKGIGHMWRISGDITRSFSNVIEIINKNAELYPFAGPGHWNDPDMLQIGNVDWSCDENRSHFAMWCMMASPLIAGNDIRKMDSETLKLLTHKDLIAINQDKLGKQAQRIYNAQEHQIWIKPLSNGELAVCFFNAGDTTWNCEYIFSKQEVSKFLIKGLQYSIWEVFDGKYVGKHHRILTTSIPKHGVALYKLIPNL